MIRATMIRADDQGHGLHRSIARLDAILDSIGRGADARRREYAPLPRPAQAMSSATFLWRDDGRPDWSGMWTTFYELALSGGPPQRGAEKALRAPGITVVAKTHHDWSAHVAAAGD
jgi:hypothetical protein